MYPMLNLPKANLKLKDDLVWDVLRKKFVRNTPEEWVRQHFIHYLINDLNYPVGLMAAEKLVKYNKMSKRCDIVSFTNKLSTLMIVECKAPKIKLTEDTFYQVAKYNFTLKAPLLILTNGLEHIAAHIDLKSNEIKFLERLPTYQENLEFIL
jgi:hypothetical protein